MNNQHDTDPIELTPPDGNSILPPDASHSQVIHAINRHDSVQKKTFDAVMSIHAGLVASGMCPHPDQKCAALEMAGTASIGVAELHGLRRRDNRWMMFVGIIIGGLTAFCGAWLSRNTTEAAAAVAAKVAVDAAKEEVQKSQKTTADIAFAAGRDGAELGVRAGLAARNPQPLVVTK